MVNPSPFVNRLFVSLVHFSAGAVFFLIDENSPYILSSFEIFCFEHNMFSSVLSRFVYGAVYLIVLKLLINIEKFFVAENLKHMYK